MKFNWLNFFIIWVASTIICLFCKEVLEMPDWMSFLIDIMIIMFVIGPMYPAFEPKE